MRWLMLLVVSGCAWQSPALDLGNGVFEASALASPVRGATTGAREMALTNAKAHCSASGKGIEVSDVRTGYAFPANGTATVTFRCK
jgi:hypothetical protein